MEYLSGRVPGAVDSPAWAAVLGHVQKPTSQDPFVPPKSESRMIGGRHLPYLPSLNSLGKEAIRAHNTLILNSFLPRAGFGLVKECDGTSSFIRPTFILSAVAQVGIYR